MTARILVVDDHLPNIKLLEARLTAEYYDVLTATNGPDALAICAQGQCDIILLDVMMPGMDGFEVCRRLKSDIHTAHLPVILVTALDQPSDRVRGLEAGADDFLTKPVDEIALVARVRSLARLKVVLDDARNRALTSAALAGTDPLTEAMKEQGLDGRILVIDDRGSSSERVVAALRQGYEIEVQPSPQAGLTLASECDWDLVIVSLGLKEYDGLRLCSQIRSLERTRNLPVLMIADLEDRERVLRGLDLGVNDFLVRPIDRNELVARVRTQIRRKRYMDVLRNDVQASLEAALIDKLTNLHNRRYLETHLPAMLQASIGRGRSLSLMVLDIDYFKSVNDTYGHPAGDEVLKGFATRIKRVIRQADLVCRQGGEEFVVAMPDTSIAISSIIAERVRAAVQSEPFAIDGGERSIPVTVSIGLAEAKGDANSDALIMRADRALYSSKHGGRNRVTADAA